LIGSAGAVAMIGRAAQFDELIGVLNGAQDGRGAAALAVGEAGMGKSTLAEAVAIHAQRSGWRVVWGVVRQTPARRQCATR
jgi:KaiC/GvpD/RAD55 family RecA-like ATPase